MKNLFTSFIVIVLLVLVAVVMSAGRVTAWVLMHVVPYVAIVVFLGGFIYRVLLWARSPVPFRIPTTCGQEKSLPWIRRNLCESPFTGGEVSGRMALEVLLFRSLFRNSRMDLFGGRPIYRGAKWLWIFGLLFHGSLAVILLRHLRFFTEPIPRWVQGLETLDGMFEIGLPTLYLSDVFILIGIGYLFFRRMVVPRLRYLSSVSDHFALLLLFAIAGSGIWMRYVSPVDLEQVKTLVLGWVTFSPVAATGLGAIFCVHLLLVCVLLAWFPFSKLMHMAGVFFSPTRNLANNSRAQRHVNPWNAPVPVHTYEEYEAEFRDQMREAGIPVESPGKNEPPSSEHGD